MIQCANIILYAPRVVGHCSSLGGAVLTNNWCYQASIYIGKSLIGFGLYGLVPHFYILLVSICRSTVSIKRASQKNQLYKQPFLFLFLSLRSTNDQRLKSLQSDTVLVSFLSYEIFVNVTQRQTNREIKVDLLES